MARPAPTLASRQPARLGLRCDRCEVTWRGAREEPCWSCGEPGVPVGTIVVVSG